MSSEELTFVCIGKSHRGIIYRGILEGVDNSRLYWKERRLSTVDGLLTNSAVCSIQNGIFLAGGDQEGHESDSKRCQTLTWSAAGDKASLGARQTLHVNRDSSAAATAFYPDYVFVSGGDQGDGMEIYSADQGSWMRMGERLPIECSWHRLTVLDSSLYSLGGRSEHVLDQCARMSLKEFCHGTPARRLGDLLRNGVWESVKSLTEKRHSFVAVTAYGRIIVIGGSNGARSLSSIEIYNPLKNDWRLSQHQLNIPRANASALIYKQSHLLILGGIASNNKLVPQVEGIALRDLLDDNAPRTFRKVGVSETGTRPGNTLVAPSHPPIGALRDFDTPPPSTCHSHCEQGSMGSSRLSTKASQAEIKREGLLDGLIDKLPKLSNLFGFKRGLSEPTVSDLVIEKRAETAPTKVTIGTPSLSVGSSGRRLSTPDPFAWYYN